jgi:D-arabinose 1-dehydrogenase-like Zn-dependent alcohol dehydrogenase
VQCGGKLSPAITGWLRQIELPEPQPAEDKVLVRVTAAGVTPLDCTILSGGHPRAKAPLVLGNEGAGVIEDAGASRLSMGSPNPKLEEPLDACASNLSLWR